MNLVLPNNPILWTPAAPVTDAIAQVLPHVGEMKRLMRAAGGVGLAGPQVGIGLRFFIWKRGTVINPEIVLAHGSRVSRAEGCLTWPNRRAFVARSLHCDVRYFDIRGNEFEVKLTDFDARVFQHECDHLDGKCIYQRPEAPVA